jgi:ADP-ribose pyrophosphatase
LNISIIERKILLHARMFEVEDLLLQLPNDKMHHYELVNHRNSVTILPVTNEGKILFVSQYRVGAEKNMLELPAGVMEDGENPKNCAAREVREEVGFAAGNLKQLGAYFLAPGYCTEKNYAFLATNLESSPLQQDEDEFLDISPIAINQAYQMALEGKIEDSKSLAALLLAQSFIYKIK